MAEPAGASGPLRVRAFDADEPDAVEASRLLLNRARAVESPWLPPLTPFRREQQVRHSWDGSPVVHLVGESDGETVVVAALDLGEWDNRDLGWLYLVVDPVHRRRGFGSAMLAEVTARARAHGCTKLGATGWDLEAGRAFAQRHGFTVGSQEVQRVVRPRELPDGLVEEAYAEGLAAAQGYELVHLAGRTPDELLPGVAELMAAINDAPTDDLDVDDEVFPLERVRDYEEATIASGHRLHRVLARSLADGSLAGHTVVAVDTERPQVGHQHDTSVLAAHRGHRLGLLLKAAMLRRLAVEEPALESIDTWNAESNRHMVAVNERLGFHARGRELAWQRRL